MSDENEDQKIVEQIRKLLLVRVTKGTNIEKTPMAWFGLELALKKASQHSKPNGILSLEQCKLEANNFAFFRTRSGQFDEALKHFVEHNIFLYYPDVLPNVTVVFCDPQVLLTMVTEIVKHHYKVKQSECGVKGTTFRYNAYITADMLESILPQYYNGTFSPKCFLKLLSDLNVVSAVNESGDHLMPALLQNAENLATKVGEIEGKKRLPPLCISFNGGCAPSGVFCSLVTTLLQSVNWKLCMDKGKPYCCYRNCITFTYQTTIITLVDYFTHLCISQYNPKIKICH